MEAHYVSTSETSVEKFVRRSRQGRLIVDATGTSQMAFNAMQALGHNGVLVWVSITGGSRKNIEIAHRQDQHRLGAGQQAAARLGQRATANTSKWASAIWPSAK